MKKGCKTKEEAEKELRQNYERNSGYSFNNWFIHLPGSLRRKRLMKTFTTEELNEPGFFSDKRESSLKNSQSKIQFWQTIDKALEDEGISRRQVEDLNKAGRIGEIDDLTMPAITRLMSIGYKLYPDLTA